MGQLPNPSEGHWYTPAPAQPPARAELPARADEVERLLLLGTNK